MDDAKLPRHVLDKVERRWASRLARDAASWSSEKPTVPGRTAVIDRGEPTALYELVVNRPSALPLEEVEADKLTNEISRVRVDGRWLSAAGRQTTSGLVVAGLIGLVIGLVCLGLNVPYLLARTRTRSGPGFEAAS